MWDHARDHGLAIVSKDNDFRQRSFLEGAPPKIIWLRVGNAGTPAIEALLRRERTRVETFAVDEEASFSFYRWRISWREIEAKGRRVLSEELVFADGLVVGGHQHGEAIVRHVGQGVVPEAALVTE